MYSTTYLCKKIENTLYMPRSFLKVHQMPLSECFENALLYFKNEFTF